MNYAASTLEVAAPRRGATKGGARVSDLRPPIAEPRLRGGGEPLDRELRCVESLVLEELALVRAELRKAVEHATGLSERTADLEALIERSGECHGDAQHQLLTLLGDRGSVNGELPLAHALVHISHRAGRMVAQCAGIAVLVDEVRAGTMPSANYCARLREMADLADGEIVAAGVALRERDPSGVERVRAAHERLYELNRGYFGHAVADGSGLDGSANLLPATLVARAIVRIGDDAVDVARRVSVAVGV